MSVTDIDHVIIDNKLVKLQMLAPTKEENKYVIFKTGNFTL